MSAFLLKGRRGYPAPLHLSTRENPGLIFVGLGSSVVLTLHPFLKVLPWYLVIRGACSVVAQLRKAIGVEGCHCFDDLSLASFVFFLFDWA
jgi:hypothetical protein